MCVEAYEDKRRVLAIAYMNARVGDCRVEGVLSKFEISRMKENGRKLIDLCMEKKLSLK